MSFDMYNTTRRFVKSNENEYLVDVFRMGDYVAIAQDISSGKFGKGSHETNETRAITEAIGNIK